MLLSEGKTPSKTHQSVCFLWCGQHFQTLFQWQIKSFEQWTLARVLIPRFLFSICLLTFFTAHVVNIIKTPWCIRKHLSHPVLLLLTSSLMSSFQNVLWEKRGQVLLWLGSSLGRGQLGDGESQGNMCPECIHPSPDRRHACKSQSFKISSWKN